MFAPNNTLKFLKVSSNEVEEVLTSVNAPYVAPPGYSTEATRAYICTLKKGGDKLSMAIYLHLTRSNKGIIYTCDKDPVSRSDYPTAKSEAMDFVESMGFIMEKAEISGGNLASLPPFMEDLSLLEREEAGEEQEVELKEVAEEEEDITLKEIRPMVEARPPEAPSKEKKAPEKEEPIEIEVESPPPTRKTAPPKEEPIEIEVESPPPPRETAPPKEEPQRPSAKRVIGKIKLKEIVSPTKGPKEEDRLSRRLAAVLRVFSSL